MNNAGIGSTHPIAEIDEEEYDAVFAVNVKAPFFLLKHGLGRLRDGGRVINVSSGLARTAVMPDNVAYAMTKGALDVLSRDLSKVLGARGITVNSVAPGIIDTDNGRVAARQRGGLGPGGGPLRAGRGGDAVGGGRRGGVPRLARGPVGHRKLGRRDGRFPDVTPPSA